MAHPSQMPIAKPVAEFVCDLTQMQSGKRLPASANHWQIAITLSDWQVGSPARAVFKSEGLDPAVNEARVDNVRPRSPKGLFVDLSFNMSHGTIEIDRFSLPTANYSGDEFVFDAPVIVDAGQCRSKIYKVPESGGRP